MGRRRILGGVDWGGFIGRLLGFPGTGADGWDSSASVLLATRRHQGGAGELGARRASCLRGAPASRWGTTEEGEKGEGKEELTGGPHMAAREEEWWVIAGPAGCVGPQGMVGCGLGEPEEGFGVV
jgi:hypothetical protein